MGARNLCSVVEDVLISGIISSQKCELDEISPRRDAE